MASAAAKLKVAITQIVGEKDDDVRPLAAICNQGQEKKYRRPLVEKHSVQLRRLSTQLAFLAVRQKTASALVQETRRCSGYT
jgi:hypothetical protein